MSNLFSVRNLVKVYGVRQVLNISELSMEQGQIFALVGPSGSGKSTLLRLLNFLEKPTRGSVFYQGAEFSLAAEMPLAHRREVTTVFQRPVLLNGSVFENVVYGLKLRRQQNYDDLVMDVLAQVGLEKLAHVRARTLSGGEAQRVALARAMVLRPEVLLLDEPTANLDPFNVGLIERIVRQMNQDYGTTVVMVTHNVFQARRMAGHVAFLLDGGIVEAAPVEAFFNRPQDPRTGAFLRGDMIY